MMLEPEIVPVVPCRVAPALIVVVPAHRFEVLLRTIRPEPSMTSG